MQKYTPAIASSAINLIAFFGLKNRKGYLPVTTMGDPVTDLGVLWVLKHPPLKCINLYQPMANCLCSYVKK